MSDAVIVSAPAPAALLVPVVALTSPPNSKDPHTSKTIPFKNAFDSLTLFQDVQHVPKSSIKKELPEELDPGTEEAVVPAPSTPRQGLPKPYMLRPHSAQAETPDNGALAEETLIPAPASSLGQGDVQGAVTVALPVPPATSLPYGTATYSSIAVEALANVPILTSTAHTGKPLEDPPTPTSTAQVRSVIPAKTAEVAQGPAQQLVSSTKVATVAPREPIRTQPVRTDAAVFPVHASVRSATPATGSRSTPGTASQLPMLASALATWPPTNPVTANQTTPPSVPVATATRANIEAPVDSGLQAGEAWEAVPAVPVAPSKSTDESSPAKAQTASAKQMNVSVPTLAAPPQIATTAAAAKVTPADPLVVSSPLVLPAERETLEPPSVSREVMDRISQPESLPATPAPRIPLLPQAENFAFAVRMPSPESSTDNSSVQQFAPVSSISTPLTPAIIPVTSTQSSDSQPPLPVRSETSTPQLEMPPEAPETQKPNAGSQNLSSYSLAPPAFLQPYQIPSQPGAPEPAEAVHTTWSLAAQEAHLLAPELPKTSASSEILLHLTSNDESAAAIRVADRGGSVNVSVHASDPVLRESLRSNLGELSTQLNDQGWKADVSKSAVAMAAQSGSQQDSHEGGQRGSQQQHSFGGERPPQRDRRSNGGQWQQEMDQQITGGDAHPGGNE